MSKRTLDKLKKLEAQAQNVSHKKDGVDTRIYEELTIDELRRLVELCEENEIEESESREKEIENIIDLGYQRLIERIKNGI